MKDPKKLPLYQALFFIFLSIFAVSGTCHLVLKAYIHSKQDKVSRSDFYLTHIIQTGPNRDDLKSDLLAELLGLSVTNPTSIFRFDSKLAEQKLSKVSFIKKAKIKLVYPNTVYIDYEMRKPLAMLYDFENIAFDEEGVTFPFYPYYTPKKLPEVYLGLSQDSLNLGDVVPEDKLRIVSEILTATEPLKASKDFFLTWLDVAKVFEKSLGQREVVACVESRKAEFQHYLRLSATNYLQDFGNYLQLNSEQSEDMTQFMQLSSSKLKMIDLRINRTAIIKDPS